MKSTKGLTQDSHWPGCDWGSFV